MIRFIGIAIDDYQDESIKNLSNCRNDVHKFMTALSSKFHFDDLELLYEKEQTTKSTLYRTLSEILINAQEEDSVLIYFAGHGEYNEKTETSYWVTNEASRNDITSWLNISELLTLFKYSPAKHIALISDSCFSGHIFDQERGGGYENLTSKKSRFALTSGSIEKVKDGLPGKNSPFSLILTEFINDYPADKLTFSELCEKTIIRFGTLENQTPCFGPLANCRHEGGIMVLEPFGSSEKFRDLNLSLDIADNVKIEYEFKIPQINKSNHYNADFLNSFITQKGYSILNEARTFFIEKHDFIFEPVPKEDKFILEVSYRVEIFNDKFLSLVISRFDYFGGPYPNNHIYPLNFSLNPERLLSFCDLIDYSYYHSLHEFLDSMIYTYGEKDSKEILQDFVIYTKPNDLDYSFDEQKMTIYFTKYMPRVAMAASFLQIPIEELTFRF